MRDGPVAVSREFIFAWGSTAVSWNSSKVIEATWDLLHKEDICSLGSWRESTLLSGSQPLEEGKYFLYLSQFQTVFQTPPIL